MKNIAYLSIIVALFASCKFEKKSVLSGYIYNANNRDVIISQGLTIDTLHVDSNSYFEYQTNIEKSEWIEVKIGKKNTDILLLPNAGLSLELDYTDYMKSIKFSGKGSGFNNYLIKKKLLEKEYRSNFKALNSLDVVDYLSKIDSLKNDIEACFVDSVENDINIDQLVKIKQKGILDYMFAYRMMLYPKYHARYTNDTISKTSNYYAFISELDLSNPELLDVEEYNDFLLSYISYKSKEILENDSIILDGVNKETHAELKTVSNEIENVKVANHLYTELVKFPLKYYGAIKTQPLIDYYREVCQDTNYTRIIDSIYEIKMLLAPGKQAPSFTLYDIDSNKVSLGDFKGKLVYIDFWATWCRPCREELPHYKALQEEFSGNEMIAFFSISLDDDRDAWMNMVNDKNLLGYQLFGGEGWNSEVSKDYQIYGIPTFVFIDKYGKIIDSQAPTPSTDDVVALINEHLESI